MQGCRLESAAPVAVNTYLELSLQPSPTAPPIIVELAAVRWVAKGQLGIEFLGLRAEQQTQLQQLVERT